MYLVRGDFSVLSSVDVHLKLCLAAPLFREQVSQSERRPRQLGSRSIAFTHFFPEFSLGFKFNTAFWVQLNPRRDGKGSAQALGQQRCWADILPAVFWVGCENTAVWMRCRGPGHLRLFRRALLEETPASRLRARANVWDHSGADTLLRRPPASLLCLGDRNCMMLSCILAY